MSARKLPLTVKQALEQGCIERYYNRAHRRYFFSAGAIDGFETGRQALVHYFGTVIPEQEAIERRGLREKIASGKHMVAVRREDLVSVWKRGECVFDGTMRQYRREVFALEYRFKKEIVFA